MGMKMLCIKPMKSLLLKSISFFIAVSICVLFITTASAHGGRTDANGGHYDRATGEYHYHHGYSAHQHPGGVCPYSYDDQTDHSSSSGSSYSSNNYNNSYSSGKYSNSSGLSSSSYNNNSYSSNSNTYSKYSEDENTTLSLGGKIKYLALLVLIIVGICFILYKYIKTKVYNSLKAYKLLRNIIIPVAIAISLSISGHFYLSDPYMALILSGKEITEIWILWLYITAILCIAEFVLFTYTVYTALKEKEYQNVTVEDLRHYRADNVVKHFAILKLFEYLLLPVSIVISIGIAYYFHLTDSDMVLFLFDQEIMEVRMLWICITIILFTIELILFMYNIPNGNGETKHNTMKNANAIRSLYTEKRTCESDNNFYRVAKNIATVYYALKQTSFYQGLTSLQILFAVALCDAHSYLQSGKLTIDYISNAVYYAEHEVTCLGEYTKHCEEEYFKKLTHLTMHLEALYFKVDSNVSNENIINAIIQNQTTIANTIEKTLEEGKKCDIYPEVSFNIAMFASNNSFINTVMNFK